MALYINNIQNDWNKRLEVAKALDMGIFMSIIKNRRKYYV